MQQPLLQFGSEPAFRMSWLRGHLLVLTPATLLHTDLHPHLLRSHQCKHWPSMMVRVDRKEIHMGRGAQKFFYSMGEVNKAKIKNLPLIYNTRIWTARSHEVQRNSQCRDVVQNVSSLPHILKWNCLDLIFVRWERLGTISDSQMTCVSAFNNHRT